MTARVMVVRVPPTMTVCPLSTLAVPPTTEVKVVKRPPAPLAIELLIPVVIESKASEVLELESSLLEVEDSVVLVLVLVAVFDEEVFVEVVEIL